MLRRFLKVAFLMAWSICPLSGQTMNIQDTLPIREARLDANGDFIPDRLGETVTVRGHASVGTGVLRLDHLRIFIQDETGGISLFDWALGEAVSPGDLVTASGVVSQFRGVTELKNVRYSVLREASRSIINPLKASLAEANSEHYEGRLLSVEGIIVRKRSYKDGDSLIVMDAAGGDDTLEIRQPAMNPAGMNFSGLEVGDQVEATGILSQNDWMEPYNGNYRLIPRSAVDIRAVGMQSVSYRQFLTASALILAAVLLWVLALRMRVRDRTVLLEQTEARFRSIYEGARDGICLLDSQWKIEDANPAGCQMFSRSRESLLGTYFLGLFSNPDLGQGINSQEQLQQTGTIEFESEYLRGDGAKGFVSTKMNLIGMAGLQRTLAVVRDVTQQRRAEQALAAEKERLSVTLHSIGDGVITTDTEGCIVLISKVAQSLTDWTPQEAMGRPLADVFRIIGEKKRESMESPVDTVLATGRAANVNNGTLLVSREGVERAISHSAAPICDDNDCLMGAVLVFTDVTERRKMQQEMLKSQKLESIGLLAGGIAHDFNNILTIVSGNLSLARMYAESDDELNRILIDAEKASRRAKDLTQQLLTFSKGGAPIKKTATIGELIRETVQFSLRGSNLGSQFSIALDLWAVDVDEGQISQVINNLVMNAQQAMPDGGVLRVTAENVHLNTQHSVPLKAGRYVRLKVTDQGVGIPEANLRQIFDPYFTTRGSGSGLGLATAYSIVKQHDGYITAESELGVGTTLAVYLPAAGVSGILETPEDTSAQGTGRVLVMDDEEMIRNLTGAMLRRFGYDVETAGDGSEAIARYQNAQEAGRPFDVVIMDLTVPGGMGGKDAIQRIRELNSRVKAIVSSGYSHDPVMSSYKDYGFCGVVAKPYNVQELSRTLRDLMLQG